MRTLVQRGTCTWKGSLVFILPRHGQCRYGVVGERRAAGADYRAEVPPTNSIQFSVQADHVPSCFHGQPTRYQHVLGGSMLLGRNRSGAEGLARDSGMRPWAKAGADGILEVLWSVRGRLEKGRSIWSLFTKS